MMEQVDNHLHQPTERGAAHTQFYSDDEEEGDEDREDQNVQTESQINQQNNPEELVGSLLQEKRPLRQSLWQAVRRNPHARCLALSLLICGCLSLTFWCQLEKINTLLIALKIMDNKLFELSSEEENACKDGLVFLPLVCLVSLYLGYLVECWHSTTRLVLMYRVQCSNVYSYVEQMRQAQPIIWWKAACFHHVRHTRPVSRYRSGSTYSSTSQVYDERVTTHVSGSYFSYSSCGVKDISKALTGLERYPTTRVYLSKGFAFANERSAAEFDEQRSTFFRANERFDHYLEIREGLDLVGVNWQEVMIATGSSDTSVCPWYNNQLTYWLFSLVLLSWPLRILLEYNTAYVHYQIVKLFGVNYEGTGDQNSSCQAHLISRVPTEDSLLNDCLIAPSYSEAMIAELNYARSQSDTEGLINRGDEMESERVLKSIIIPNNGNSLESATTTSVPYPSTQRVNSEHSVFRSESSNRNRERRCHQFNSNHDHAQAISQHLRREPAKDYHLQGNAYPNFHPKPQTEPPSYDEVMAHLSQGIRIESDAYVIASQEDEGEDEEQFASRRPSLKSAWNHLLGLLRVNYTQTAVSGSSPRERQLPRSFTDKDFFQKLLAAQFMPAQHRRLKAASCKTSSSYGDISPYNPIAHV